MGGGKLCATKEKRTLKNKKCGSFSQKIVENFCCQNPFRAILRRKKKVPMAIKPRGGGLSGRATKERTFFLRLPLAAATNNIDVLHCKHYVAQIKVQKYIE